MTVRRRPALALACLFALVALLAPGTSGATGSKGSAALDTAVLGQLNAIRAQHGLVPLTLSPQLSAAAEQHTSDMLAKGYFGHNSSDGAAFWQRIARYYSSATYGHWSVGENLLWSEGRVDAAASLATWMRSPGHRANILFPGWRQIGIASESSPDAPGAYGGLAVTVITTDFGVRT
jgi:uncharacterized protein YkwD